MGMQSSERSWKPKNDNEVSEGQRQDRLRNLRRDFPREDYEENEWAEAMLDRARDAITSTFGHRNPKGLLQDLSMNTLSFTTSEGSPFCVEACFRARDGELTKFCKLAWARSKTLAERIAIRAWMQDSSVES